MQINESVIVECLFSGCGGTFRGFHVLCLGRRQALGRNQGALPTANSVMLQPGGPDWCGRQRAPLVSPSWCTGALLPSEALSPSRFFPHPHPFCFPACLMGGKVGDQKCIIVSWKLSQGGIQPAQGLAHGPYPIDRPGRNQHLQRSDYRGALKVSRGNVRGCKPDSQALFRPQAQNRRLGEAQPGTRVLCIFKK